MPVSRKVSIPAAILAVAITVVGTFEGMRTHAYLDSVGVATICEGETEGVHLGQTATLEECKAKLATKLQATAGEVGACLTGRAPTAGEWIAYTSVAYNIGTPAFCGSSMARQYNAGNYGAACDALLLWDRAGGHPLPGLTMRRQQERMYCRGYYDDRIRKATDRSGSAGARLWRGMGGERLAAREGASRGRRDAREARYGASIGVRGGDQGGASQDRSA